MGRSGSRARVPESRSSLGEDRHLRGWPDLWILRPDGQEPHRVFVLCPNPIRPRLELQAGPLKAMILMAQTAGGQSRKFDVVLDVRRGHNNRSRLREMEDDPLEGSKSGRIEVLDNLHDGGGVISLKSLISIHQRALDELDSPGLPLRKSPQIQPLLGDVQRSHRDIHADDLLESWIGEQRLEESPFAATQVEYAARSASF